MNTRPPRRFLPRPAIRHVAVDYQLDAEFADYRSVVTAVFANHRHLQGCDGGDSCSCGSRWPCPQEELAAQLLDNWV